MPPDSSWLAFALWAAAITALAAGWEAMERWWITRTCGCARCQAKRTRRMEAKGEGK